MTITSRANTQFNEGNLDKLCKEILERLGSSRPIGKTPDPYRSAVLPLLLAAYRILNSPSPYHRPVAVIVSPNNNLTPSLDSFLRIIKINQKNHRHAAPMRYTAEASTLVRELLSIIDCRAKHAAVTWDLHEKRFELNLSIFTTVPPSQSPTFPKREVERALMPRLVERGWVPIDSAALSWELEPLTNLIEPASKVGTH